MNPFITAATELRSRGFGIVWLREGEKRPSRKDWTLRSQESSDYVDGSNLGLLCGRLSGDLVCVDLDSPAALLLADQFLPPTGMIDGRPSKLRAHRFYRVTDIPPEMVSTAAGGIGGPKLKHFTAAGIDFIGTGGQVAVPPSIHRSGEVRGWEGGSIGDPATLPLLPLWEAVTALARKCGWVDVTEPPSPPILAAPPASAPPMPTPPASAPPAPVAHPLAARAAAYIATIESVEGHGGDVALWRAACALTVGFDLPIADAVPLLVAWNRTNATPPWDQVTLGRKLQEAAAKGADAAHPRGWLISGGEVDRPVSDPIRLADEFPGVFRCHHGSLYRYTGQRYSCLPEEELAGAVRLHIGKRFVDDYAARLAWYHKLSDDQRAKVKHPPAIAQVTARLVAETVAEKKARCIIPSALSMPCEYPPSIPPREFIAVENGLLDLTDFTLRPHSERWFSTTMLPYRFDPAAEDTSFRRFLTTWFADDDCIALWQEWVGYVLTRSTDAQAFMLLIGDGCNGKSAASAMLEATVGVDNCSYLPWQSLTERFQLYSTYGKLLNVSDDIGELDRASEGLLKWWVGGKPVSFERKHKDAFDAMPTARLMLSCNQPPHIADRSQGVWRRLLVLPFDARIPDDKKIPGMDKATWWYTNVNMAAVLNWAIVGLRRLRANGLRFTVPKSAAAVKEILRTEANPALMFLLETVVADADGKDIKSADLFRDYRTWVAESGYKPLAAVNFSREVKRAFPGVESKLRKVGGTVARYWFGLRPAASADRPAPRQTLVTSAAPRPTPLPSVAVAGGWGVATG